MGVLPDSDLTDDQADALSLASSFRAASDDDIRRVMNAMSDHSTLENSMQFFIVPSSWFRNAFSTLTARTPEEVSDDWRDQIGRVTNKVLLNVVEVEASSDMGPTNPQRTVQDSQKQQFEQRHRQMQQKKEQSIMRKGLQHQQDYFFLGPSAWMLVKEKFGFDGYELGRPCVPSVNSESTLAIQLRVEESEGTSPTLIGIPASGRFAYEKVVQKATGSTSTNVVPEDDEGTNESPEDAEDQDEASNQDDSPILLLPPSTTMQDNDQSGDAMDIEQNSDTMSTSAPTRRKALASGLGNLGNTCFMNSILQCLAHTEPLRRYFLSGEYRNDLNRDNALGTGGELATQFADLLSEMWGITTKQQNGTNHSYYANSSTSAVYPRSFKYCLGKHAERFVGYNQHDAHELATYLLDALHEDTNRITKKPYIEKPEPAEDEPDEVAAERARNLDLQRDDSRVLEYFMGQEKSRLECCRSDCNRVSVTFDSFMYLSVPIPGAAERTLKVTFAPLDPTEKLKTMTLTINKNGALTDLLSAMNDKLLQQGSMKQAIPQEDLCVSEIWSHEIFSWYENTDEVEKIRDSDETFIYQLRTLAEVQEESKQDVKAFSADEVFGQGKRTRKYKVDLETMTRLNKDDVWQDELGRYVRAKTLLYSLFNPKRGTEEELMQFYRKLDSFIDLCHREIAEEEESATMREADDNPEEKDSDPADSDGDSSSETLQGLVNRSDLSTAFKNVKTRDDVAILEFCLGKLRQFIIRKKQDKRSANKDGILVQVILRQANGISSYHSFAQPFVLRIPSTMSVYGFRELLSERLSRSLNTERANAVNTATEAGESSEEGFVKRSISQSPGDNGFGSPELMILRQTALKYDTKNTYSSRATNTGGKALGVVSSDDPTSVEVVASSKAIADKTDEAEQVLLADIVGPKGSIYVDWSQELFDRAFDAKAFEEEEDLDEHSAENGDKDDSETTTVLDCIEKYCQREQLDESEMWYCNKCQEHVRAWKQFHLYSAPPILIINLKRFQFSATTHQRDKINSFIDFPLEGLDLTNLVSNYEEGKEPIYNCYAVSNHYGGMGAGHYTAHILSDDGTWCYYDDSRVQTNVSPTEVVSKAAYVLFYRRQDVPIGQDLIDVTSPALVIEQDKLPSYSAPNPVDDDDDDGENDNMAVDGDDSSRTLSSPAASFDGDQETNSENMVLLDVDPQDNGSDSSPLQ